MAQATSLDNNPPIHFETTTSRRGQAIAQVLQEYGVTPNDYVVVCCCEHHDDDRAAGQAGTELTGAIPVIVNPQDLPLELMRSHVVLACAEGTTAWQRTAIPARLIGDGPGISWWRLAEQRALAQLPPLTAHTSSPN